MAGIGDALALDWMRDQFEHAERLRDDAAERERSAYQCWLDAVAAYDAARDAASDALRAYSVAVEAYP